MPVFLRLTVEGTLTDYSYESVRDSGASYVFCVSQAGDRRVVFCSRLIEHVVPGTNVYGTRTEDGRVVVVDSHEVFLS